LLSHTEDLINGIGEAVSVQSSDRVSVLDKIVPGTRCSLRAWKLRHERQGEFSRVEPQVQLQNQVTASAGLLQSNTSERSVPVESSEPKNLYDILFSPFTAVFAAVALTASFFLPDDGLGIDICWIRKLLDLPCPGCGLTRSITCISHLHFSKSWAYHPFGLLFYGLFVTNILLVFSPRKYKNGLRKTFSRHGRRSIAAYGVFITCFVVSVSLGWSGYLS
jgi:hypothetical protein